MLLTGTSKRVAEHQLGLWVLKPSPASTGHAHSHLTFRLSSLRLFSEMLFVPTMINESKAGTEKLRRKKHERPPQPAFSRCRHAHSLLAAAPEDLADIHRQAAEVAAVQTHPHRPVAQFAQSQRHGAEVQQAAVERHTQTTQ